jgi:hypothetical protein
MREINIPFDGFYDSMWSSIIDHEIEQTAENDCARQADATYEPEHYQRPELRVNESTFHDAIFDATNYRAAEEKIARDYVDAFRHMLKTECGLDIPLKLKAITSPRYYNFETDRLFSNISAKSVRKLFAYSRKLDNHATLRKAIEERHTSRSGFHSYYSNVLAEWLAKPVTDWDHNELATLLCVAVSQFDKDWRWSIFEVVSTDAYSYVDSAVDWKKYESAIESARDDLRAELVEEDPDYLERIYRCPHTLEMFPDNAKGAT